MTRMVAKNPHSKDGYSAITKREGILFSDVRLHIGLVLRSKNPHVFRPDLFRETVRPTAEVLSALAESRSLVKLRYISQEPLVDDRHLRFMAHLADAVADCASGAVIFDVVSDELRTAQEFKALLADDVNGARFEMHVQVIWLKHPHTGHGETRGLMKKGLPELKTDDAHLDHQVLVTEVLLDAARVLWNQGTVPTELDVCAYGDTFRVAIIPTKSGPYRVRIARIQETGAS